MPVKSCSSGWDNFFCRFVSSANWWVSLKYTSKQSHHTSSTCRSDHLIHDTCVYLSCVCLRDRILRKTISARCERERIFFGGGGEGGDSTLWQVTPRVPQISFFFFGKNKKKITPCNCRRSQLDGRSRRNEKADEKSSERKREDTRESPLNERIRLHSRWFALLLICTPINWPQLQANLWHRGCSCHHNPHPRHTLFRLLPPILISIADEKLSALPRFPSAACIYNLL